MPKPSRAKTYVRARAKKPDPRHLAAMLFAAFMFLWILTTLALAATPQGLGNQTIENPPVLFQSHDSADVCGQCDGEFRL